MIRGLTLTYADPVRRDLSGMVRDRPEDGPGVVAILAAYCGPRPWLKYEGAVVRFDLAGERGFELTPARWRYINHRAQGAVPDPGVVENVAELLWCDGVPTRLEPGVVEVEVVNPRSGRWRGGLDLDPWDPRNRRDPYLAVSAYERIVEEACAAAPPEIGLYPANDNTRRQFEGKGTVTEARCYGCDEIRRFEAGRGFTIDDSAIRVRMTHAHRLCGILHPQKTAEAARRIERTEALPSWTTPALWSTE